MAQKGPITGPAVRNDPPVANDWGLVVRPIVSGDGPGILANGAETIVGAVAVSVVPANPIRKSVLVQNVGLGNIRVGIVGVTATTGVRLEPGDTVIFNTPFCVQQELFSIRDGLVSSIALAQEVV